METNEPPKNTLYIIFNLVYLKNELDDSHFLSLESNWHAKTKLVATEPFSRSCLSPLQTRSKCEVFVMQISFHSYVK